MLDVARPTFCQDLGVGLVDQLPLLLRRTHHDLKHCPLKQVLHHDAEAARPLAKSNALFEELFMIHVHP